MNVVLRHEACLRTELCPAHNLRGLERFRRGYARARCIDKFGLRWAERNCEALAAFVVQSIISMHIQWGDS